MLTPHSFHQRTDYRNSRTHSPVRFYVAVVMRMVLSRLTVDYEFKCADPTAQPFQTFGKTRLPRLFIPILVCKREGSGDGESD